LGAKVHRLKGLKLHAKLMLADSTRVIIGSINLAPGKLRQPARTGHRGAGRGGRSGACGKSFTTTGRIRRPLDLSDAGLLRDLQENEPDVAHMLALNHNSEGRGEQGHHRRHDDNSHHGHGSHGGH
jgi:cardiolipin synthase